MKQKLNNKIIYIHLPNKKVNKEYKELFPFSSLRKNFEIIAIYGQNIFCFVKEFKQVKFFRFTRTLHASLHFCVMWHRKYSSLSYKLRAYQYFGSKRQVISSSNWLVYNGRRHRLTIRFFVYLFSSTLGIIFLKYLLGICFIIEGRKKTNRVNYRNSLLILPYGGGISLEFDFLVWQSRKQNALSVAIQENWDNLSSKSFLFQHPSYFLTWSKQSSSHLRTIQSYTGIIREVGSLRLNNFYRQKTKLESPKYGLNRSKNSINKCIVLVIGTGPANHDFKTIAIINESLITSKKFDFKIIYRPHPFSQISKSDLDNIKRIKNLELDLPNEMEKNSHRLKMILDSTVVVSLYSTVLLESTILNKYCIIPSFVISKLSYPTSNFLDDSPHYAGLSNFNTIKVANSKDEFLELITTASFAKGKLFNSREFLNWYCKDTNTTKEILEFINEIIE
jgi:hypothetical protein